MCKRKMMIFCRIGQQIKSSPSYIVTYIYRITEIVSVYSTIHSHWQRTTPSFLADVTRPLRHHHHHHRLAVYSGSHGPPP